MAPTHLSARNALRDDPASGACCAPHPANAFSRSHIASALSPKGRGDAESGVHGNRFLPLFSPPPLPPQTPAFPALSAGLFTRISTDLSPPPGAGCNLPLLSSTI